MEIKNYYNVCEDSYELYQYCKEQGFYEGDYDEWMENGEELSFFEGDPDMIKLDGQTGYFFRTGDTVFYYFDCIGDQDSQIEGILRDFFNEGQECHFGYYKKFCSHKHMKDKDQNWDTWHHCQNALAYRGGAGYVYDIIPLRQAA